MTPTFLQTLWKLAHCVENKQEQNPPLEWLFYCFSALCRTGQDHTEHFIFHFGTWKLTSFPQEDTGWLDLFIIQPPLKADSVFNGPSGNCVLTVPTCRRVTRVHNNNMLKWTKLFTALSQFGSVLLWDSLDVPATIMLKCYTGVHSLMRLTISVLLGNRQCKEQFYIVNVVTVPRLKLLFQWI